MSNKVYIDIGCFERGCACHDDRVDGETVSVVKHKEWVGLTDEEQQQAYEQWQNDGWGVFYNAIEAKLKEKNT